MSYIYLHARDFHFLPFILIYESRVQTTTVIINCFFPIGVHTQDDPVPETEAESTGADLSMNQGLLEGQRRSRESSLTRYCFNVPIRTTGNAYGLPKRLLNLI